MNFYKNADKRLRAFIDGSISEWVTAQSDYKEFSIYRDLASCESPIEAYFGVALHFSHVNYYYRDAEIGTDGGFTFFDADTFKHLHDMNEVEGPAEGGYAYVCPQARVGEYRVDYLIAAKASTSTKIYRVIVECDGHEFHEKTKEQAARDKKRDRTLTNSGFTVFRFTGSEIFRDPQKCADEVAEFLNNRALIDVPDLRRVR